MGPITDVNFYSVDEVFAKSKWGIIYRKAAIPQALSNSSKSPDQHHLGQEDLGIVLVSIKGHNHRCIVRAVSSKSYKLVP